MSPTRADTPTEDTSGKARSNRTTFQILSHSKVSGPRTETATPFPSPPRIVAAQYLRFGNCQSHIHFSRNGLIETLACSLAQLSRRRMGICINDSPRADSETICLSKIRTQKAPRPHVRGEIGRSQLVSIYHTDQWTFKTFDSFLFEKTSFFPLFPSTTSPHWLRKNSQTRQSRKPIPARNYTI